MIPWEEHMWNGLEQVTSFALMMRTEMFHEMLVVFNEVTWLVAQKGFINFSHRESITSYNVNFQLNQSPFLLHFQNSSHRPLQTIFHMVHHTLHRYNYEI
jgi:hypothetical protein